MKTKLDKSMQNSFKPLLVALGLFIILLMSRIIPSILGNSKYLLKFEYLIIFLAALTVVVNIFIIFRFRNYRSRIAAVTMAIISLYLLLVAIVRIILNGANFLG